MLGERLVDAKDFPPDPSPAKSKDLPLASPRFCFLSRKGGEESGARVPQGERIERKTTAYLGQALANELSDWNDFKTSVFSGKEPVLQRFQRRGMRMSDGYGFAFVSCNPLEPLKLFDDFVFRREVV